MTEQFYDFNQFYAILQQMCDKCVPLRHIYDNTKKSSDCKDFEVFRSCFGLDLRSKRQSKIVLRNSDVSLTTTNRITEGTPRIPICPTQGTLEKAPFE